MEIYKPEGRALEYCPLALNYFVGCNGKCLYCYVPDTMGRYRPSYQHSQVVNPNQADLKRIEKSAKKHQGCDKQILLSFTGDPYCSVENGETRIILEILNHYNHKVAILTKNPDKALRDLDVIQKFGDRIKIGSTLTFDNDVDSKKWEAGTSLPQVRIDALKEFSANGIKTWASFEPVIIPEQSINLLIKVSGFINHVRIGKINNYKGLAKQIDWTQFIDDVVQIARATCIDDRFYIKKDLLKFNNGTYLSENEINQNWLNL